MTREEPREAPMVIGPRSLLQLVRQIRDLLRGKRK
jgi:hypothetical protein